MKSLSDKDAEITSRFKDALNWQDRYHLIIQIGKNMAGLEDSEKLEELKVKGCQSQVWIKAEMSSDGKLSFRGDSDALIVRGLVSLVLELFSGERPQDIISYQPKFIEEIGLAQHLSPSRSNGLMAMLKQIKFYAIAYQAKANLS